MARVALCAQLQFSCHRPQCEIAVLLSRVLDGVLQNQRAEAQEQATPVPTILPTLITSNFPSAPAMAAMIFYGLLAYLIVRRFTAWRLKVLVVIAGAVLILLIGFSRMYLGSDYLS